MSQQFRNIKDLSTQRFNKNKAYKIENSCLSIAKDNNHIIKNIKNIIFTKFYNIALC